MNASLMETPAWQQLQKHKVALERVCLADMILNNPERLKECELVLNGLRFNYAFNGVTSETIRLLVELAQQQKLEESRAALFGGGKVNVTENRPVLHTALRQKKDSPVMVDGRDVMADIKVARQKMAGFSADVRCGNWKGATGSSIKHVVNIGIGGSDLGPRLVVEALRPYADGPQLHFVANADAYDILSTLKMLDPAETLFVIVSKTFTTQETLLNAQTARKWLTEKLGEAAVARHFVAVSTNQPAAEVFGIQITNVFPMWDWVGGRFSLWSAVGLSIALAVGMENFEKLCDGAAAMDEHFLAAPLERNMPVVLGLLGVWHRNFLDAPASAVLPYSERLRNLPRYLQQLEMESNGKSVTRDGKRVNYRTAPIVFGECGTVGQHSCHQWLHQGSDIVPADFIGISEDDLKCSEHHRVVLANMVAQVGALAFGQPHGKTPQDVYTGNRSSNVLLLDCLDPEHLGMLIALYEHKVFVQGIVWNINSFDQPGVELGKKLARELDTATPSSDPGTVFLGDFLQYTGALASK